LEIEKNKALNSKDCKSSSKKSGKSKSSQKSKERMFERSNKADKLSNGNTIEKNDNKNSKSTIKFNHIEQGTNPSNNSSLGSLKCWMYLEDLALASNCLFKALDEVSFLVDDDDK